MSFASNGVANPKVASQAEGAGEIASQSDDKMINVVRGNNVRAYVTVVVLFIINLLNYMDRQTVAGLLDGIQSYFDIQDNNSAAGLLQTVFICSYMVLAPVFGYLGDRYRRKYLMAAGILVWSGTVFASTMLSKDSFWWFLVLRGVVGIGEASYSTIAPTVIADLFTGDMRTRMLSFFYFAIPVGSGLGYIVGTEVAALFGHQWQWGLRVTPIIGAVCVFLCIFVVHEPKRGAIERGENPHGVSASDVHNTTSWWADLKYLTTVKSFIWLNLGFTCVSFVTGALAFWAPKFLLYATRAQGISETESEVSLKVGIITCVAGIVGVWLGAEIAWRYRTRNRKADALVCAVALIGSAPFLYGCLVLASTNIKVTYALIFFGEVLLFMNWAPVGDMVLYIIIPSRRSTAEAAQILVSHLFGDAGSPWLVGEISDRIRGAGSSDKDRAQSMEYSLLMSTFISVIGGFCFIMCSIYLVDDREKAEQVTRNEDEGAKLVPDIKKKAEEKGVELILPVDFVCSSKFGEDGEIKDGDMETGVPDGFLGLDIGPKSIAMNDEAIKKAKTIVWNGPMGVFEMASFEKGTKQMMETIVKVTEEGAVSVIGGGDTATACKVYKTVDKVSHCSTGGGASLELLEGKVLPGVAALDDK